MIWLYAEKKTQLTAISLQIGFPPRLDGEEMVISVEENSVSIIGRNTCMKFKLDDVELSPLSCRGLLVNQDRELQMTLQYIERTPNPSLGAQLQCDSFQTQSKIVQDIEVCGSQMFCCCCGQRLLHKHSCFTRVLPLPSENWLDNSDMWFCHKHEGHENDTSEKPETLTPKANDCLVGTTYIRMRLSHVNTGSVNCSQGELLCSRCGVCVGACTTKSSKDLDSCSGDVACKLYLYSISFSPTDDISDLLMSPESLDVRLQYYLSQLLIEESRMYTSFRFIVTSTDNQEKSVKILVWLLDENLEVYQSSCSTVNNITIEPVLSLKLLYRCLLSHSKPRAEDRAICRLWERDNGVHGVNLPYSLSLHFISILINSTKQLPKSTRQLNGFNVGLLKVKRR